MTIAIGMLCDEGLIIAADTMAALTDGTTRQAVKIHEAFTDSFACVIANAAADGNAVNTLVPDILADLRKKNLSCFADAEKSIRNSMFQWADQFRQGNPDTQLIIGISIIRPSVPDVRLGGGIRLYYGEPPNTMLPVELNDASTGYVGAGMGASITDPIFRTLFGMEVSVNVALRQTAYLMYRAKKDAASSCGGETHAVVLKSGSTRPLWVVIGHQEADKYDQLPV